MALADTDRYGLEIIQEIEHQTSGDIRLGPGTFYNAIKKMLEEGLVEQQDKVNGSDPRRIYYSITEVGRQAFHAEASRLAKFVESARNKKAFEGGV